MTFKEMIDNFNVSVNTAFNKGYMELEPEIASMVYKFNSGAVPSTDFPITKIMSKIKKFYGNRVHNSPADGFKVTVTNEEYDGSVDIPRRDLLRAQTSNSITGLDLYVKEISALGAEAKDTPYEEFLDMLEVGDASTYGTTFDGQNFFDTTHAFDNVAGTQSNMLTGTGVTDVKLVADLNSAIAALRGFYYTMDEAGGNSKKRKLNKGKMRLMLVCDDSLYQQFNRINTIENIGVSSNSETNYLKGALDMIISRPFTDANDWYLVEIGDPNIKPFILSMEEEAKLENPSSNDNNAKEHKIWTWGIEGFSYGKAYGAWWKAVMVTNT